MHSSNIMQYVKLNVAEKENFDTFSPKVRELVEKAMLTKITKRFI